MAPAIRVTAPAPLHVMAVGAFGHQVASRLAGVVPGTVVTVEDGGQRPDSSRWPTSARRVVVAWRPVPRLAARLDDLCHNWGDTWFSAILEHPYLRVGPTVVPGSGPCHECFDRRRFQHDPSAALVRALYAAYDDPAVGPVGHLPHHAALATVLVLRTLADLDGAGKDTPGVVRRLHLLDGSASTDRITGMHGCPRCGLGRDEVIRSVAPLAAEVRAWRAEAFPR